MAQKVIVSLIDDLDGSDASETVSFSIDGSTFEMELNKANAEELRNVMAPYRSAARKLSGQRSPKLPKQATSDTAAVRKWADDNNIPVNPRGRIRMDVLERYAAARS